MLNINQIMCHTEIYLVRSSIHIQQGYLHAILEVGVIGWGWVGVGVGLPALVFEIEPTLN